MIFCIGTQSTVARDARSAEAVLARYLEGRQRFEQQVLGVFRTPSGVQSVGSGGWQDMVADGCLRRRMFERP